MKTKVCYYATPGYRYWPREAAEEAFYTFRDELEAGLQEIHFYETLPEHPYLVLTRADIAAWRDLQELLGG